MNKPLKILVVLPLYGGSLPIGRFCVQGLQQAGHIVDTFEAPDFYSSYEALDNLNVTSDKHSYLQNSFLQMMSQAILAKVETYEPDMVLAMAQAPLTHSALKRLKKDNVLTAMWFVEDFNLFTYWQSYAPFYDIFAIIQKEPFTSELEKIGVHNHLYLPLAAQPSFHQPQELSPKDEALYGSDVSFMGAGYPNRRVAFRKLIHHNLKIWGSEWDGDHILEPYVQLAGRRVSSQECVKIFNGTKINLNLHSSIEADKSVGSGDFINPRTFELAACGAFQLVDRRSLMAEAFADGELAHFESLKDLDEKIAHFLHNEDERKMYAAKSQLKVLKEHTYCIRMQTLIDFAKKRFPNWPAHKENDHLFSQGFPEELKVEILKVINELGLPENVGFDDIITCLKNKTGELTSLETTLLFLEEWKRCYKK